MALTLHGYWRSSATYRVRIALNLKQLAYQYEPVHLVKDGGKQHQAAYRRLNPSALVPTLVDDQRGVQLNQSLSIIEYLEECYPDTLSLLPTDPSNAPRCGPWPWTLPVISNPWRICVLCNI